MNRSILTVAACAALFPAVAAAQTPGEVVSSWRLDNATPGFTTDIPYISKFGTGLAALGDVDGDGHQDLLVGGPLFNTPSVYEAGRVWTVHRDGAGGVSSFETLIDSTSLSSQGFEVFHLGFSAATLGDVDGDGVDDVAIGAFYGGVPSLGMVVVVFRDVAGGVKSMHIIHSASGDLPGLLEAGDGFGTSVAALGDIDGDGVPDLAVGAADDDDGGSSHNGAVWLLRLAPDGSVSSHSKISMTQGGFTGDLTKAGFGRSIARIGDLDGNGVADLAVGALENYAAWPNKGSLWILMLDSQGAVIGQQRITQGVGGFSGTLSTSSAFGCAVAGLGDVNGDGKQDIAVGAPDDTTKVGGRVFLLSLNPNGTVASQLEVGPALGFGGVLKPSDSFGVALCRVPDTDGNGVDELAVGASGDDGVSTWEDTQVGAVWILRLDATLHVTGYEKIGQETPGVATSLESFDAFGSAVAPLGDLDGDGHPDLAVGSPVHWNGTGALHLASVAADHSVAWHTRLDSVHGGLPAAFAGQNSGFAASVASVGDLNGDGTPDLAVGSPDFINGRVVTILLKPAGTVLSAQAVLSNGGDIAFGRSLAALGDIDGDGVGDFAAGGKNSVWIVRLKPDGKSKAIKRIAAGLSGFVGPATPDGFGASVARIGDIDHDGLPDIAVGSPSDSTGGAPGLGGVWLLSIDSTGQVHREIHITQGAGGLGAVLSPASHFGSAVASAGDLDGDGLADILVGASGDADLGPETGSVRLLLLAADGTVKSHTKIGAAQGLDLAAGDRFGGALAAVGDLDDDGLLDWAVGSPGDDCAGVPQYAVDSGSLHLLTLQQGQQHWSLTGPALAGSGGKPVLSGNGILDGVTPSAVKLEQARPNAAVVLVFGTSSLLAPFKGGTMVPAPLLLVSGLLTDPAGKLQLALPWPTGLPSGFEAWFQDWIADPAGPKGWAASNGLVGYVP